MKSLLQRLARSAGYEIRRYAPASSERARLAALLRAHGVDLVLDVGANSGQYARELRAIGFRGEIVSFEPIEQAHRALSRSARPDPLWHVAPRTALGERHGEVDLQMAENLVSSSILEVEGVSVCAAAGSRARAVVRVPIARLDSAAAPYLEGSRRPFLKIDVQGYEPQVIEGARGILELIVGVQLEMSLVPLYKDQALMWQLHAALEAAGFAPHALMPGFSEPHSGRLLQVDGVYFRR